MSRFCAMVLVLVFLACPAWASDTGQRGPEGGGLEEAMEQIVPQDQGTEADMKRQAEIDRLENALDPESGIPKTIRDLRALEQDQPWAEGVRRSLENAKRHLRERLERLKEEQREFERQRRERSEDDPHKKIPVSRIERGTSFQDGGDDENALFTPGGGIHVEAGGGCGNF